MIKNLFKKATKPVVQTADVMEVVTSEYPKVVQEIHNEFIAAGDKLLAQAQEILLNLIIDNEEKAQRLEALGFSRTKEVVKLAEVRQRKAEQERIANTIQHFRVKYPNYKFITKEIVKGICNKYNLVLGESSQYKGFVPSKNLSDIELFFNNHPDDKFQYTRYYNRTSFRTDVIITKQEYDRYKGDASKGECFYYRKTNATLMICAPISDMDTKGYKKEGFKLVKEVPDPIVLLPKNHNGIEGFLIITAWGDEASDPDVINEGLN